MAAVVRAVGFLPALLGAVLFSGVLRLYPHRLDGGLLIGVRFLSAALLRVLCRFLPLLLLARMRYLLLLGLGILLSLAFAAAAASAVAVGSKVVNLSQVGISALSTGVGTMCGQNIGAGKPDRAGQTIRVGVRCALTVAVVMFCIIQAIPGPLVKLFNRDPAALEESIRCLRYLSLMAFPSAFFFIYVAISTAVGFTTFSMFCHVLDGVVVRVVLSLLLTQVFGMGLTGVYLAMGLAPTLSAVIAGIYFYSGKWRERKLLESEGLTVS